MDIQSIIAASLKRAVQEAATVPVASLEDRVEAGIPAAKAWLEANIGDVVYRAALAEATKKGSSSDEDLSVYHALVYSLGELEPDGFPNVPGQSFERAANELDLECTSLEYGGTLQRLHIYWA